MVIDVVYKFDPPPGLGKDESIVSERFEKGEIVIKLTRAKEGECSEQVGMVITKEDYHKRLYSHDYMPLIYIVDLEYRLAYLFGCLNYKFRKTGDYTYTFWWRAIHTNHWHKWFHVPPYSDSIFGN